MAKSDHNKYIDNCDAKTCFLCIADVPDFEPIFCWCSDRECSNKRVPVNAPICDACKGEN